MLGVGILTLDETSQVPLNCGTTPIDKNKFTVKIKRDGIRLVITLKIKGNKRLVRSLQQFLIVKSIFKDISLQSNVVNKCKIYDVKYILCNAKHISQVQGCMLRF